MSSDAPRGPLDAFLGRVVADVIAGPTPDTPLIDGNGPGCVCGPGCETPCWQRAGLHDQACCPGCAPLVAPVDDGTEDVIWTARGLHHHPEVVHGPAQAARPSTARQYIAVDRVDALLSEVSRDFAGAHVNAGSVTGSVRRRLKEMTDVG